MKNFVIYSYEIVRLFFIPMIQGTFLGGFPLLFFYGLILIFFCKIPIFETFSHSYDSNSLSTAQTALRQFNRAGLFALTSGFWFLRLCSSELMAILQDTENNKALYQIMEQHFKNLRKKYAKNIKKTSEKNTDHKSEHSSDSEQEEKEDNLNPEFYVPRHNPFMLPNQLTNLKLRAYYSVIFLCILLMVYFMVNRTSKSFQHLFYFYLFFWNFLKIIMVKVASKMLMDEILLTGPLLAAFDLILFYVFFKVDTFTFYQVYFTKSIITVSASTLYFFSRKMLLIAENFRKNGVTPEKWSAYFFYISFRQKINFFFKKFNFYIKKEKKTASKKFGFEPIYKKEIPRELLLLFLLDFSSRGCANLMRFIVSLLNLVYPTQEVSDLPSHFPEQAFLNNLLFSALLIVFDIILIYLIENLLEFEILNLLNFYRYRFDRRRVNWLFESYHLDVSLKTNYRTLDYLGFSYQYFMVLSCLSVNIAIMSYVLFIIVDHDYNFFNDASALLVILLAVCFVGIFVFFIRRLIDPANFWARKQTGNPEKYNNSLRLESYIDVEYNIHRENFVVQGFLTHKKNWLIQNLEKVLKTEDFLKNEGYLIDLYLKVTNHIKSLEISNFRTEIIDRYKYVAAVNSEDYSNSVVRAPATSFANLATIIHYWLSLSKEAIYFQKQVSEIGQLFKKRLCEDCHTDENLVVVEKNSFYKILSFFRSFLKGALPNKKVWKEFYKKHQIFVTLCQNCEKIRSIKRFKRNQTNLETNYNKIKLKSDFSQKIMKDLIKIDLKQTSKIILHQWWLSARSRILNKKQFDQKTKIQDQMMKILDEYESNY